MTNKTLKEILKATDKGVVEIVAMVSDCPELENKISLFCTNEAIGSTLQNIANLYTIVKVTVKAL